MKAIVLCFIAAMASGAFLGCGSGDSESWSSLDEPYCNSSIGPMPEESFMEWAEIRIWDSEMYTVDSGRLCEDCYDLDYLDGFVRYDAANDAFETVSPIFSRNGEDCRGTLSKAGFLSGECRIITEEEILIQFTGRVGKYGGCGKWWQGVQSGLWELEFDNYEMNDISLEDDDAIGNYSDDEISFETSD